MKIKGIDKYIFTSNRQQRCSPKSFTVQLVVVILVLFRCRSRCVHLVWAETVRSTFYIPIHRSPSLLIMNSIRRWNRPCLTRVYQRWTGLIVLCVIISLRRKCCKVFKSGRCKPVKVWQQVQYTPLIICWSQIIWLVLPLHRCCYVYYRLAAHVTDEWSRRFFLGIERMFGNYTNFVVSTLKHFKLHFIVYFWDFVVE